MHLIFLLKRGASLSRVIIEGDYLKTILTKLKETRRSVEDLIDTIEMLSTPSSRRSFKRA